MYFKNKERQLVGDDVKIIEMWQHSFKHLLKSHETMEDENEEEEDKRKEKQP